MFRKLRPAAGGADRALERSRERAAAGSVAQQPIDWPVLMPAVAEALLGEPSSATRRELRYGRKGSLSVRLDTGQWFDHEAGEGGGVLDLVTRERGSRAAALAWLEAEGFIGQRDPALRAAEGYSERRAVKTGIPRMRRRTRRRLHAAKTPGASLAESGRRLACSPAPSPRRTSKRAAADMSPKLRRFASIRDFRIRPRPVDSPAWWPACRT